MSRPGLSGQKTAESELTEAAAIFGRLRDHPIARRSPLRHACRSLRSAPIQSSRGGAKIGSDANCQSCRPSELSSGADTPGTPGDPILAPPFSLRGPRAPCAARKTAQMTTIPLTGRWPNQTNPEFLLPRTTSTVRNASSFPGRLARSGLQEKIEWMMRRLDQRLLGC